VATHLENMEKSVNLRGLGNSQWKCVLARVVSYHQYCSWDRICKKRVLHYLKLIFQRRKGLSLVIRVYVSITVRNNMHFIVCCRGWYFVNIHLTCWWKVWEFDHDLESGYPVGNSILVVWLWPVKWVAIVDVLLLVSGADKEHRWTAPRTSESGESTWRDAGQLTPPAALW